MTYFNFFFHETQDIEILESAKPKERQNNLEIKIQEKNLNSDDQRKSSISASKKKEDPKKEDIKKEETKKEKRARFERPKNIKNVQKSNAFDNIQIFEPKN